MRIVLGLAAIIATVFAAAAIAQTAPAPAGPYKIINSIKPGGAGGFDYVYADSAGRKLYVPRGNRVDVFDLDTLKPAGSIDETKGVHGAVVDVKSNHGFCSSNPVVMWDTQTLKKIKTIDVKGRPDGILFDAANEHVLILSHEAPNVTVIDAKDGSVVRTIDDLGGEPEQGVSDDQGHLYIDLEDKGTLAVVDSKTLKVTGHYDLGGKAGGLAGLAFDAKNHILFACGRDPATCTILNSDDGTVITTLPIGKGVDAAEFNPATMEAFVSSGDAKLTIIKETDPKNFAVEQTLTTMNRAKTCTLDSKTDQLILIGSDTAGMAPATAPAPVPGERRGRGGPQGVFTILVVGKEAAK